MFGNGRHGELGGIEFQVMKTRLNWTRVQADDGLTKK